MCVFLPPITAAKSIWSQGCAKHSPELPKNDGQPPPRCQTRGSELAPKEGGPPDSTFICAMGQPVASSSLRFHRRAVRAREAGQAANKPLGPRADHARETRSRPQVCAALSGIFRVSARLAWTPEWWFWPLGDAQ